MQGLTYMLNRAGEALAMAEHQLEQVLEQNRHLKAQLDELQAPAPEAPEAPEAR